MPKIKVLSGKDLLKIFKGFGFELFSQKGSHVKLVRILLEQKQILIIPNHKTLDRGTLKAIYRQSTRFISERELK